MKEIISIMIDMEKENYLMRMVILYLKENLYMEKK